MVITLTLKLFLKNCTLFEKTVTSIIYYKKINLIKKFFSTKFDISITISTRFWHMYYGRLYIHTHIVYTCKWTRTSIEKHRCEIQNISKTSNLLVTKSWHSQSWSNPSKEAHVGPYSAQLKIVCRYVPNS